MKLLLFILVVITSTTIYAQSQENIDSINSKYNRDIAKYQKLKADEIKTLSSENYLAKKSKINIKYDTTINRIVKERDIKMNQLRLRYEIEEENKQKIERLKADSIQSENEKRELFEASDYGELKNKIKTKLELWLKKNEFENQQDYESRLKNNLDSVKSKIINTEMSNSKWQLGNSKTGSLLEYNVDNETFQLIMFTSPVDDKSIFIHIPKNLAESLKKKFGGDDDFMNAKLIIKELDFSMVDNYWKLSKALIVFPNMGIQKMYSGKEYYDDEHIKGMQVEEEGNEGYLFKYPQDYYRGKNVKPFYLIDIKTQFTKNNLDEGIYYYKWQKNYNTITPLDFSLESLNIKLPN